MAIRFRSRHLLATVHNHFKTEMDARGWIQAPINFGTQPLLVLDYAPDERSEPIRQNTVVVSLGDFAQDDDEELGSKGGGLRSGLYNVFYDVYMAEQALSIAICDDIRDVYTDLTLPLVNQINSSNVPGAMIEVELILGPERGVVGVEQFRRYWRTMRVDARLYFNT